MHWKLKRLDLMYGQINLLRVFSYILPHLIFPILYKACSIYITVIREFRLKEYFIYIYITAWHRLGSSRNRTQSRSFSLRGQYVFHYHKSAFISIISLSLEYILLQMFSYSLRTGSNTTFSLLLQHFNDYYRASHTVLLLFAHLS